MPSGHRPPIPPGVARVALLGTFFTHRWTQIFYLNLTGTGITAADLNTLATAIANDWNTDIAPNTTGDVTLTEVQIVYVPSVGNEVVGVATVSHAGTRAGTTVKDASACYCINWQISAYYRGGHPRSYMPGVLEGDVTNGSDINTGSASGIASAWGTFRGAVNSATTTNISAVQMGTLSFQTANSWRTTPLFRAYNGQSVRLKLASQRRRILS